MKIDYILCIPYSNLHLGGLMTECANTKYSQQLWKLVA